MPLKVAFDTSVLGYAQYGAGGRTGVFRMVDNLARTLARRQDCDLYFCGGENFRMWTEARRYLADDPVLGRVPTLSYGSPARVYSFLGKWFYELAKEKKIALPAKVWRRALGESLRTLENKYRPIERADIADKNVYHSSFYPLPRSTRSVKGLSRFLTVCDIINILHPEVSTDSGAFLKHILSTLEGGDRLIAISQATKDDLCGYLSEVSPERVTVMPLAASALFQRVEGMKVERPYFLSVATVDKRKNLEGLVNAFADWIEQTRVTDVDLVLVGSLGEAAQELRRCIGRRGEVAHRIRLLGYIPDEKLAPLYSGALGFIYPSLFEGFGLPVLEAMQCGVPVVTSDRHALKELAEGYAMLINPEKESEISQALDVLYRSPSERARLSQKGMERACQYSWEKSTDILLSAYSASSS